MGVSQRDAPINDSIICSCSVYNSPPFAFVCYSKKQLFIKVDIDSLAGARSYNFLNSKVNLLVFKTTY